MAKLILVEDLAGPSVLGRGGAATYVMQWAHGLRRLGHEVLLIEMLSEAPQEETVSAFGQLMSECWIGGEAALVDTREGRVLAGPSPERIGEFARNAAAAITLAAHYRREPWPLIEQARPRIMVDQDPGYTHLWAAEGEAVDVFGEHDLYFTVGTGVGGERCALPTLGIEWHPIFNPVVMDWWHTDRPLMRDRFTTVASWRDYGYLEWDGRVLGPKAEQWEKLMELPARSGERVELVMDLHELDPDRLRLIEHGWRLEDPSVVGTPASYRDYIEGSLAELSVAKGGYVGTRSGWFSDRSACYLAAGRPVVLQSTGFEEVLPTGEGLLAFTTLQEAAEAMASVRADYDRHSRAAREIAREHLASERVLPRLLDIAGIDT